MRRAFSDQMSFSHKELCSLAVNWLKRPHSRGGHGCNVAIDECRTGWTGEVPDALGYRFSGIPNDSSSGTVLVECKVSRADFLADGNKPHRQANGVGNWRYYMAPAGLIRMEELPENWGLVEVNQRGHCKLIKGPYLSTSYSDRLSLLASMRFESETVREFFLLARLFDRIADPQKLLEVSKEKTRLGFRVADLSQQLQDLRKQIDALHFKGMGQAEELARYRSLYGELPTKLATPRAIHI